MDGLPVINEGWLKERYPPANLADVVDVGPKDKIIVVRFPDLDRGRGYFTMSLPFGGEKDSSLGCYGGEWILEELTTLKWISVQKEARDYPIVEKNQ